MDLTPTRRFAYDIVQHVLTLHNCEVPCSLLVSKENESNCPVLYKNFGKHMVQTYFENHKDFIEFFCTAIINISRLSKQNFENRLTNLIEINDRYDKSYQMFYLLCIKLTLFGHIATRKGQPDALITAIEKIDALAAEAYLRGDLDEKFDCIFNFAYDILQNAFSWSGCDAKIYWDLKPLILEPNSFSYGDFYDIYFKKMFEKKGMIIKNAFTTGWKEKRMTKEIFLFQIQDWCDIYYTQLGEVEPFESYTDLLDLLMKIALFSVYAVELFYPCSIRVAQESMIKLVISAEKSGLWTTANQNQLKIENSIDF